MKIHLHQPVKILYFLPAGGFKIVSHNFKIFLHFQQYTIRKLSSTYNKGFSYMLFLFLLQFHDFKYQRGLLVLLFLQWVSHRAACIVASGFPVGFFQNQLKKLYHITQFKLAIYYRKTSRAKRKHFKNICYCIFLQVFWSSSSWLVLELFDDIRYLFLKQNVGKNGFDTLQILI